MTSRPRRNWTCVFSLSITCPTRYDAAHVGEGLGSTATIRKHISEQANQPPVSTFDKLLGKAGLWWLIESSRQSGLLSVSAISTGWIHKRRRGRRRRSGRHAGRENELWTSFSVSTFACGMRSVRGWCHIFDSMT